MRTCNRKPTTPPWTLWLPVEIPSLNVWQRMHWAAQDRLTQRMTDWAAVLVLKVGIARVCATIERGRMVWHQRGGEPERRRATVISIRHRLITDKDNFWGGMKPLWDALRKARVIVDDSDEWLQHGPHIQRKAGKGDAGTMVIVEPLTDGQFTAKPFGPEPLTAEGGAKPFGPELTAEGDAKKNEEG